MRVKRMYIVNITHAVKVSASSGLEAEQEALALLRKGKRDNTWIISTHSRECNDRKGTDKTSKEYL